MLFHQIKHLLRFHDSGPTFWRSPPIHNRLAVSYCFTIRCCQFGGSRDWGSVYGLRCKSLLPEKPPQAERHMVQAPLKRPIMCSDFSLAQNSIQSSKLLLCVFTVLASIPCESAVVDQIACQQLGLEYQAVQHETLRNPTAMAYLETTMQQQQPRQLVKMKQYFKFVTLLARPGALYAAMRHNPFVQRPHCHNSRSIVTASPMQQTSNKQTHMKVPIKT